MDHPANVLADSFELTTTRRFAAPPDAVFNAWIDPAQLAKWMGPRGIQARVDSLDARAGGAYRISFLDAQGVRHVVDGIFREITPPKRLVMTWIWEAARDQLGDCLLDARGPCKPGHETLITVELRAVDNETELTLTHENFPDQAARDGHANGWNGGFDKLAELLAGEAGRV